MKKAKLIILLALAAMATNLTAQAATAGSCEYQWTDCGGPACGVMNQGSAGNHVYVCDTWPHVRMVATCCGGA